VIQEVISLLRKEFRLEIRRKYALGGILLYVFASVYIVYAGFFDIPTTAWNAIFWILMLFASINAVAKSFVQENRGRQLYYYQLARPSAVLISKMIYNTGLLFVIAVITFFVLATFAGNPIKENGMFLLILVLASLGLSISFTFTSAIAAKADGTTGILAILSFPIVIPILMSLVKLTAGAMRMIVDTAYAKDIFNLLAIDGLLLALTFFLFPYLWRD